VTILDRRQIYLDEALDVSRVCSGAVRYTGAASSACVLVPGGTEGPAALEDAVIGANAAPIAYWIWRNDQRQISHSSLVVFLFAICPYPDLGRAGGGH